MWFQYDPYQDTHAYLGNHRHRSVARREYQRRYPPSPPSPLKHHPTRIVMPTPRLGTSPLPSLAPATDKVVESVLGPDALDVVRALDTTNPVMATDLTRRLMQQNEVQKNIIQKALADSLVSSGIDPMIAASGETPVEVAVHAIGKIQNLRDEELDKLIAEASSLL